MHLHWRLPRRPASVPHARQLIHSALSGIGVTVACREEVALAVTEACANAVRHAQLGAEYVLTITTTGDRCVIEVADTGIGFDPGGLDHTARPANTTVAGRGLFLISHYTDTLELRRAHPRGLSVRMSKRLVWNAGAAIDADPGAPAM
jgi:serine/threonine-protein kinase RsbW